jgi:hypothetical protein
MKDREQNQFEGMQLPPAWCGALCRNAMNEICIEHCALKRDCSAFEPKPNLKLEDMPRFPETKNMTKEEKFASVTVYLSKVVDHLQGNENAQHLPVLLPAENIQKVKTIAEIVASLSSNGADNSLVDTQVVTSKENE